MFAFIASLFHIRPDPREALQPLYDAVVAEARLPHWYRAGQVPDTIDGRFEMVAALLSLVLMRMQQSPEEQALLTELFVNDMDSQLRQEGVGDVVVGKRIGKMIGALGGRLGAYRDGLSEGGDMRGAVIRNIYGNLAPADEAIESLIAGLRAFRDRLAARDIAMILAGKIGNGAAI